MREKKALFTRILAGLSTPSMIFLQQNYPRRSQSDLELMRGDFHRVGLDFKKVIAQEHDKLQTSNSK